MSELLGAKRVRELLAAHGVHPEKSLGQNFVIDPNTIRKVITVADVTESDDVLEIGAGAGSLTVGLASVAHSVTAVEFDSRIIPALRDVLGETSNVQILEGDALRLDLSVVPANKLVANLPYNIAVPVVMKVLEEVPSIEQLIVMTQREVGERLAASPGNKSYGTPTVLASFFATARVAGRVSRNAFWPVPRVDSVIVRLTRTGASRDVEYQTFATVVRNAFAQRRKKLRNSLADVAGSTEAAERALESVGIDPRERAESVGLDGYLALARALSRD